MITHTSNTYRLTSSFVDQLSDICMKSVEVIFMDVRTSCLDMEDDMQVYFT